MAKPKRIYLVGPEVSFPATEHQTIVAEKKACSGNTDLRVWTHWTPNWRFQTTKQNPIAGTGSTRPTAN